MFKQIIQLDPSNVEDGVEIKIPEILCNYDTVVMEIKYYSLGYIEQRTEFKEVQNAWFYSPDWEEYDSSNEELNHFMFPIHNDCPVSHPYLGEFSTKRGYINLSIRDIYYGNELPQYYKQDFTLICVIEFK